MPVLSGIGFGVLTTRNGFNSSIHNENFAVGKVIEQKGVCEDTVRRLL